MNRGEAVHDDLAPAQIMDDESLPLQQNLLLPSAPRLMIYNWRTEEDEPEGEVDPSLLSHPPSNSPPSSLEIFLMIFKT
jgi:hypothetical protein